jgi:hypothetical protein
MDLVDGDIPISSSFISFFRFSPGIDLPFRFSWTRRFFSGTWEFSPDEENDAREILYDLCFTSLEHVYVDVDLCHFLYEHTLLRYDTIPGRPHPLRSIVAFPQTRAPYFDFYYSYSCFYSDSCSDATTDLPSHPIPSVLSIFEREERNTTQIGFFVVVVADAVIPER